MPGEKSTLEKIQGRTRGRGVTFQEKNILSRKKKSATKTEGQIPYVLEKGSQHSGWNEGIGIVGGKVRKHKVEGMAGHQGPVAPGKNSGF